MLATSSSRAWTRRCSRSASELRRLARRAPLVLAGAGATEELCARLRVDRLDGDLLAAAGAAAQLA